MPDDQVFETMKLEYVALRAEIIQSISYQHQILLAGYGATGVFVSYIAIKSASPSYLPALIIIPFILLGMASLWIVECNRMVRASYYIGEILWRSLQEESKCQSQHFHHVEWECWIRSSPETSAVSRKVASAFRKRQHRYQSIVILWGPVFLSVLASILAILNAIEISKTLTTAPQNLLPWMLSGLALAALGFWCRIYFDLRAISDLGKTPIHKDSKDGSRAASKH